MTRIEELKYELAVREANERGEKIECAVNERNWGSVTTPTHFNMIPFHKHYRISDPYSEFKDAEAAGKIVLWRGATKESQGLKSWDYIKNDPSSYSIHEPEEKWAKEKKAFEEGKVIQEWNLDSDNPKWYTMVEAAFHRKGYKWRIKPEPKYVPFTDPMELKGKWVCYKHSPNSIWMITKINTKGKNVYSDGAWRGMENMLDDYTMEDGSPCGVLVEEGEVEK